MSVFNWNIQLNLSHLLQVPTTVYSQFYKTFFFRDKKSSKYDTLEARIKYFEEFVPQNYEIEKYFQLYYNLERISKKLYCS